MLAVLEDAVTHGRRIMLEGAQGAGLSMHHGHYPHVTVRDTTASGRIADAGIHPRLVRRVVMVARTYPLRVGGKSGPLSQEIDFGTISGRSRKDLAKIKNGDRVDDGPPAAGRRVRLGSDPARGAPERGDRRGAHVRRLHI